MNDTIGLGRGAAIHWAPAVQWRQSLAAIPAHSQSRLSFMTEAHHRVRSFVVRELVRQARPLQPEWVAAGLGLPLPQVEAILETLEQKLFFLVRNPRGQVVWAFPFTVEPTAHVLRFSTGQRLYGA